MAVSLSDQYVLLLQNVVNENRLLREQMKNTVDQTKSSLEEIKKKVDNIENLPPGRNPSPSNRTSQVYSCSEVM